MVRLALAQLNVTVGDLEGNRRRILQAILQAKAWRADVAILPELAIPGYPPEDLLLKPAFVSDNLRALASLERATEGLTAIVGFVDRDAQGRLYNAAAVLSGGGRAAVYHKQYLPNYGVFDEKRYFTPGTRPCVLNVRGARIGVTICEDLWEEPPCRLLARAGCALVVNLSASPYYVGKALVRQRLFAQRARTNRLAVACCNLIGGQDELIFDGASLILDAAGGVVASGRQCQEDVVVADLPLASRSAPRSPCAPTKRMRLTPVEEVYEALVLGVRDYVRKNGFATVVLGLSGGIDSSLTACLAVDALGPAQVVGVVMPSRFSSRATQADARAVARALGIRCETLSIEPCFRAFLGSLRRTRRGRAAGLAKQNLQARIRGTLLMALSNTFGWLVLTTGNKSEMATGYTTLYGDMAGGFAVIKDVPKTLVYALARFRNQRGPGTPIPGSVLRRAPTAELAPHQRDQDTLPPYAVLDRILKSYVEDDRALRDIVSRNHVAPATVRRVIRMVDRAEYKRRQGPPGVKITPRAFGKDRRMPITNRYQES